MNLPNKLTILRTILIPFFLVALLCDKNYGGFIPFGNWIALGMSSQQDLGTSVL